MGSRRDDGLSIAIWENSPWRSFIRFRGDSDGIDNAGNSGSRMVPGTTLQEDVAPSPLDPEDVREIFGRALNSTRSRKSFASAASVRQSKKEFSKSETRLMMEDAARWRKESLRKGKRGMKRDTQVIKDDSDSDSEVSDCDFRLDATDAPVISYGGASLPSAKQPSVWPMGQSSRESQEPLSSVPPAAGPLASFGSLPNLPSPHLRQPTPSSHSLEFETPNGSPSRSSTPTSGLLAFLGSAAAPHDHLNHHHHHLHHHLPSPLHSPDAASASLPHPPSHGHHSGGQQHGPPGPSRTPTRLQQVAVCDPQPPATQMGGSAARSPPGAGAGARSGFTSPVGEPPAPQLHLPPQPMTPSAAGGAAAGGNVSPLPGGRTGRGRPAFGAPPNDHGTGNGNGAGGGGGASSHPVVLGVVNGHGAKLLHLQASAAPVRSSMELHATRTPMAAAGGSGATGGLSSGAPSRRGSSFTGEAAEGLPAMPRLSSNQGHAWAAGSAGPGASPSSGFSGSGGGSGGGVEGGSWRDAKHRRAVATPSRRHLLLSVGEEGGEGVEGAVSPSGAAPGGSGRQTLPVSPMADRSGMRSSGGPRPMGRPAFGVTVPPSSRGQRPLDYSFRQRHY